MSNGRTSVLAGANFLRERCFILVACRLKWVNGRAEARDSARTHYHVGVELCIGWDFGSSPKQVVFKVPRSKRLEARENSYVNRAVTNSRVAQTCCSDVVSNCLIPSEPRSVPMCILLLQGLTLAKRSLPCEPIHFKEPVTEYDGAIMNRPLLFVPRLDTAYRH